MSAETVSYAPYWYVVMGAMLGAGITTLAITWYVGKTTGAIVGEVLKQLGIIRPPLPGSEEQEGNE